MAGLFDAATRLRTVAQRLTQTGLARESTAMRSRVRLLAHVLERSGLALVGAAGGLFVGAHVGTSVAALTTQEFLIIMIIVGGAGFYLGIDTPPHRFQGFHMNRSGGGHLGRIDVAEMLTAVGTFFAALTVFVSVALIMFGRETHIGWTAAVMLGWAAGVLLQISAGVIARIRR